MVQVSNYSKAFVELNEIIKYFDDDIKNKIPDELKESITSASQVNYKFVYNENKPLYEQSILPETKALLSILYSDYLCSIEEKKKWDEYDYYEQQLANKKIEKKSSEAYNVDEIFKDRNTKINVQMSEEQNQNSAMIEYKELKWYQKLLKKILKVFRK